MGSEPHRGGGRYFGIGIYSTDQLWSRMVGVTKNADAAKATLDDDSQIIVVVDSRTGEIRQCGNNSGYCVGMNPWTNKLGPQQGAPIGLSEHAADIQRKAELESNEAAAEPAKEKAKAR
jgi:hypothetical protein